MSEINTQRPLMLHVITGLTIGGAELTLCHLLEHFDWPGSQSLVVSLGERGRLADRLETNGIEVVALRIGAGSSVLSAARALIQLVKQRSPQLIQGWMYHGNLAASIATGFTRRSIPVLWNVRHSVSDLDNEKPSTARLIRLGGRFPFRPRSIIYNSHVSADQHEALGYPPGPRVIIPNGFDCDTFHAVPDLRDHARAELGIDPATVLIGLVGRLTPTKDHRTFLEAAALLATERPEVRFLCVGDGPPEYRESLRQYACEQGLGERVIWAGERAEMPAIYNALDLLTTSSRGEAFPNVVGEAMACEVPCVVTDVGDSRRLVGETGVVVPPREPAALAAGWRKMLDLGVEKRAELGLAARRHVQKEYSLSAMVTHYAELYSEVLD
jgi:glycosyltransferase involved in cell wall biosynthesis